MTVRIESEYNKLVVVFELKHITVNLHIINSSVYARVVATNCTF